MAKATSLISFLDTMADILRLPDECLEMAYLYINKYKRFQQSSSSSSPSSQSQSQPDPLDDTTLSLASLSLAAKTTESPRRLRELLLPAHRLLHPLSSSSSSSSSSPPTTIPPLTVPSPAYDTLRATLVQAELILLRVLGFDLRLPHPLEFLPRYLARALEELADATEDYEEWDREQREEYGVVGRMDTGVARACRAKAIEACKNYRLANFFPARAIAAGCLFVVLTDTRGLQIIPVNNNNNQERWLDDITSGKVDMEDFEEVLVELRRGG